MRVLRVGFLTACVFAGALILAAGLGLGAPDSASADSISVTIANFSFSPAVISVTAGDSVTWTNNDTVAHTVTASDGSFDTGEIQPGASASITFSTAGTFAYICSIHPSMTGTVDVAVADNGNGNDNGTGTDNPVELPDTGSGPTNSPTGPASTVLIVALGLLAAGTALRPRRS